MIAYMPDFYNQRFLMFVLDAMAREYEKTRGDIIRMTLGKSELPLHPDIIKTMQDCHQDFQRANLVFPGGLPELKDALSEQYRAAHGVRVKPEHIVISTGTSTLFRNLFYLLLRGRAEVLLPRPYYPLYYFCALLAGCRMRFYEIDTSRMRPDMKSFRRNFTAQTRVVVINNPGNPLGNIISASELREMDTIVDGRAVIISDEIYDTMCFDEQSQSVLTLKKRKSPYVVTNAFSKGYRMYSRRIGYCIAPQAISDALTVIQQHTLLTVDPVVQYGAIAALQHPQEVVALASVYKTRRDYFVAAMSVVPAITVLPAQGSFYISLDCREYMQKNKIADTYQLAVAILKKTGVATVPGSDFGMPTALRISFSTGKFTEGTDRLVQFFKSTHRVG